MKRLLSPFHISLSSVFIILVSHRPLFCFLKILSSFLAQGLCASYCSLCSGCPPLVLSLGVLILQISINMSSEGTSLAIFSKSAALHPNYISLLISFVVPPQHKIILMLIYLVLLLIYLLSLRGNLFHGRDLGFCLLLCP